MPFLNELGLQRFWNDIKKKVGDKLEVLSSGDHITISLFAVDNSFPEPLSSIQLDEADSQKAGLFSAENFTKLDGIAPGATANEGTITSVHAGVNLTGGGSSGDISISHDHVGTPGKYGPSYDTDDPDAEVYDPDDPDAEYPYNQEQYEPLPTYFGGEFRVPIVVTGYTGHVERAYTFRYAMPDEEATESSPGLMSAADKAKLASIPDNDPNVKYAAYLVAGEANGVATLDEHSKVPSSQLPGFVDDVLEYPSFEELPATGESGKIYITLDDNECYRWSGTQYALISSTLALGETSSTAYRGDRGAQAYAHAVTYKGVALSTGLYEITTNSQGHVIAGNPVSPLSTAQIEAICQ